MNFSLANMNATAGYLDYNNTKVFYDNQFLSGYVTFSFVFIICCIGVLLNGIVIWLLGFQIKRNPFTVLMLNLAIADFVFLLFMIICCIGNYIYFMESEIIWEIIFCLFNVSYIDSLFLLTAISIDRCVCVLFPIWHRCSRPKYLSSAVCAFLWIFSFLLIGLHHIIQYFFFHKGILGIHLVVATVLSFPLITIATMILFFKICLQPKQIKRGRLLLMILITLLCFIILTLPLYFYVFFSYFLNERNLFDIDELNLYLRPCASLNSSINPVIYFLVGRKKRARTRESIKVIFQRVFREDETPEI